MVKLFRLEDIDEIELVRQMVQKHAEYTASDRAWKVLALWQELASKFVKVYPNDYRRVIETQKRFKESGLADDDPGPGWFKLGSEWIRIGRDDTKTFGERRSVPFGAR